MLPITVFPSIARVALTLFIQAKGGTVRPPWTCLPVQASPLWAVVASWTQDAEACQLAVVASWTVVAVDSVGVVHLSRRVQAVVTTMSSSSRI